jgi:hypothetical protein
MTPPYTVTHTPCNPPSITCHLCQRRSYHPVDVANHYCGWCHKFLDDVAAEQRLREAGEAVAVSVVPAREEEC